MRILYLSPIGNVGGAERVLLTAIATARREWPHAVVRLMSLSDGPLLEEAAALGAEVEVLLAPKSLTALGDSQTRGKGWMKKALLAARAVPALSGSLRLVSRLRHAVKRFAPDLVHSNGIKTHLLSRLSVPPTIPVVWHAHDYYSLRPVAARLLRRCRGRARVVAAISASVAADLEKVLPGVPVIGVPNAIDLVRFSPVPGDGADLDRRANLPPAPTDTVRIGLVATFARWKGHQTFLDAAAKLAAEALSLPLRWYIIGGPIYQTSAQFTLEELRTAAVERRLGERIGFVGFVQETSLAYRSLDVVVHASTLPEPFGLTIAEAMACGRPVVVGRAGGAAELFTDGEDAIGFTPGDSTQLAAAVRRLAEDVPLRDGLGAAARRTAEARFDANFYCRQLFEAYRIAMGDRFFDANEKR